MKKKILSLLTAFAMVFGIIAAPFTSASAADETTNSVTVHKLLAKKESTMDAIQEALKEKYVGSDKYLEEEQEKEIKDLYANVAEEIKDVYFAVKYNSGANNGKYVTIEKNVAEDATLQYGAVDSLEVTVPEEFELLAGKTGENGIKFTTKGLKGDFLIEEIHEKSSYVGKDGEALTDSKAVPVEITLPLVNNDGIVPEAHVYPKNTEDKPEIDKNFKKADTADNETELEKADGFTEAENGAGIGVGADYKNYQKKKATAEAEVGKVIPYEVKTKIPAKSNLKTSYWSDEMTEGLTFNEDSVKLTIDGQAAAEDYTLSTEDNENGFKLVLADKGLEKVNGKDKEIEVVLTYTATVNENAISDIPEANDITFHYGNNSSEGNTPIPTKPNENGELTVNKTWADGVPAPGEEAEFTLKNAQTGEVIGTVKFETNKKADTDELETKTTYTPNANYTPIGNEDKDAIVGPANSTEVKTGNEWSFKFTGLDKELQYKVEEKNNMNEIATFEKGKNGEIKVTNKKSKNPQPLNPTEPKVVLGGKKFVKTDEEGKRLAGAEFYVKNSKGEYLVPTLKESNKVEDKKKALDDAVDAYNTGAENIAKADENDFKATVGETEYTDKAEAETALKGLKTAIDKAQEEYNKEFKASATKYEWKAKEEKKILANAVVLKSDAQGRFEISGLEYAKDYALEEKTPPKGFAKLNGDVKFEVAKGTYNGTEEEFKYEETVDTENGEKQTYGKQIINKLVTIPQTGGIGSLIFIAAGLAIMGGAFVAYKKSQATA